MKDTHDHVVLLHALVSPLSAPPSVSDTSQSNVTDFVDETMLALVRACFRVLNAQESSEKLADINLRSAKQIKHSVANHDGSSRMIEILLDTGSNAHITNDMSVFLPDSVVDCSVQVCGISKDNKVHPMLASKRGDVLYKISETITCVLYGVLYLPSAVISASADVGITSTVLVSGSRFVRECNMGLFFKPGGSIVEFVTNDGSVAGSFHSTHPNLYTHNIRKTYTRKSLNNKNSKAHTSESDSKPLLNRRRAARVDSSYEEDDTNYR